MARSRYADFCRADSRPTLFASLVLTGIDLQQKNEIG